MDAIRLINKLQVYYRDQLVGVLGRTPDNTRCTFEYDKEWLVKGFSISPLELPLQTGIFVAEPTPFYGNFGIFEDSLPDGYGRFLLNRLLQKRGIDELSLTPLQRLAIVGSSGMGALRYEPQVLEMEAYVLPELHTMQQMALEVLAEKTTEGTDTLYMSSGNSGGCRPKCLYRDDEGQWLVKFRHTYDPIDMGREEFRYNQLAKACGIEIAECKLLENTYFASKRFDVSGDGQPLHVATAAALLNENINPPKTDYKVLLALTGFLTQSPSAVEQMFRRMVFNVLIENKDDHAKNFSFVHLEEGWCLAPAYDLTRCAQGYNGEHATSVMGNGSPSKEDMLAAAESIRIPRAMAVEIIKEIENILSTSAQHLPNLCCMS